MNGQRHIYTVTQLSRIIKQTIEQSPTLTSVLIKGELSNVTYHSSGHIYCTLKDDGAIINAAFFKYANRSLKVRLEEGMSIIAEGNVSVYEKRGSYQLIIKSIIPDGIGQIQLRIEQLKKKLMEEGLFDQERKRPLPMLPRRIGVVTSPTGAAFRDILKVLLRRFPNIEILLAPAKVQGDDAPETIVRAIQKLNDPAYGIDLIIAGRGGGSFEDLLPFSEEIVVRAYAESRVPIISAVGHQIDHPLSDDAADVCVPTPSAAAEIAVPVKAELAESLAYTTRALGSFLERMRLQYRQRLESVRERRVFSDPLQMVALKQMRLDDLSGRLRYAVQEKVHDWKHRFTQLPDHDGKIRTIVREKHYRFTYAVGSLEQLSPLSVLARGYAAVKDRKGQFIQSSASVSNGDGIDVYFFDGKASCRVESVNKETIIGKEKETAGHGRNEI